MMRLRCGDVVFVDGDVEAALVEFLFHVDDSGVLVAEELVTHPEHFFARKARFGDIDGGAGEVRADYISLGFGSVAVGAHQTLLIFDSANSRTDDQRRVELGLVGARELCKEIGGPGATVPAILRQRWIYDEAAGLRNTNQQPPGDAIVQIGVVFNALKRILFRARVLTEE